MSDLACPEVAIVGGGPAGLMAAEVISREGVAVHLFDAMPSVGRKFLLAGKGGLNLTHGENDGTFRTRYGARQPQVEPWLQAWGAAQVREWARGLGVETFVGSSGRVFPTDLKAAPLLRAWLHRLRAAGVRIHSRHRWVGWGEAPAGTKRGSVLRFQHAEVSLDVQVQGAVVLALGGASWPRLGSNGAWVEWLRQREVDVAPLQPANCGFEAMHPQADGTWRAGWSEHLSSRFAGAPLKNVALRVLDAAAGSERLLFSQLGECVVTASGLEGSLVYAASSVAREAISRHGRVVVHLDLLAQRSPEWVMKELAHPRGSRSLATHLKSRLGIEGVKAALMHEVLPREVLVDPGRLGSAIKGLPITLRGGGPIAEAISTAGGVRFESLDERNMLRRVPGVFCAGEMIDWEAPTGGYLLTACLASGVCAGHGVLAYLQNL